MITSSPVLFLKTLLFKNSAKILQDYHPNLNINNLTMELYECTQTAQAPRGKDPEDITSQSPTRPGPCSLMKLTQLTHRASMAGQTRRDDEMEGFELHEAAFPDRAGKASVYWMPHCGLPYP